jgi:eukaryotic-like serine/threonine-protein kinase
MGELRAGDLVDQRYRVSRMIGSGGMASVFEVHDVTTGRRCAMKVLHRQLLLHPVIPQRFLREAQAASALDTPFSVKVESTGNMTDGSPYIVMEFLEGAPLNAIIEREAGRFDSERVLYLADQVAQGIHDAHARGIIHRDLKPENIFVIPTPHGDLVKVVDFGISKIFSGEDGVKLTQTGVTVGTPQYMPVEQLRGTKGLDGRVDVYALGVVLFEMFAGVRPYDGFTYEEVILKVATTTAPSLGTYRSDLLPGLVQVVDRAMARERDERIGSMSQLRQEMAPYWSGRSPVVVQAVTTATLDQSGGHPMHQTGGHPMNQTGGHPMNQTGGHPMDQTGGHPMNQTGGHPMNQTGGHPMNQPGAPAMNQPGRQPEAVRQPRPSAGRTQVIEDPSRNPPPAAPIAPARTLPDHEVPSAPVVASAPAVSQDSPRSKGPSKTLVWVLVIVAAGLLGLLVAIGAVALYLFL